MRRENKMERDGRELCSVELSSFLRGWERLAGNQRGWELCGIVEGGQGFVTETCRVHKFVSVVFCVLESVEMSCNCLSFSNNEYLSESWCSSYAAASVYLGVVATTRCDRSPARITQSC